MDLHFLFPVAAAITLPVAPAAAQVREEAGTTVSGEVTLTSDYRFRGASLSNRSPALQGGLEIDHRGWFAGAWASTAENMGGPGAELDFYAGRRGEVAGLDYALTARAYMFDGQPAYFEGEAKLGRDFGPVSVELELSYAPAQASLTDNLYLGAEVEAPLGAGVALVARGGYEDSYFFGDKLDWELGARWTAAPVIVAASLVGAHGDHLLPQDKDPGTVVSVTVAW